MKFPWVYILRQAIFWFLFFMFGRLIFLVYNHAEISNLEWGEILGVFWHDKRLDLSVVCYMLILPWLLVSAQTVSGWNPLRYMVRIYHLFLVFLVSVITASELGLYDEWGTKINYKAIEYLEHPGEVMNTAGWGMTVMVLLLVLLQMVFARWLYRKTVVGKSKTSGRSVLGGLVFLLLLPVPLFLGMRGGWKPIPINQSASYFSHHNVLNQAAVNSSWNLIHSITENYKNLDHNPFIYMPDSEAQQIVHGLYEVPQDTFPHILTTTRPNIVMIILESWSADLIPETGGDTGITSAFGELAAQGVLFTNTYATGTRSHEGMAAIFSGFPGQSITTIVGQPDKFPKLPMISKTLKKEGYHTSFLFGGQLIYGNIKGFIYNGDFDKIIEGADFDGDIPQGRLGVHDEYLFKRQLNELNYVEEPLLSVMFTLSTHAPFDMPMNPLPIQWGGEERMYLNSARYTDNQIRAYFEAVRKEKWYPNTLFILVADHSHRSQRMRPFYSIGYHKIPMMFYGEVIKKPYRGMKVDRIVSQVDLAATLLAQMNIDHSAYHWSKNALNPSTQEFAFNAFTEGFGWIRPDGNFSFQHVTRQCFEANMEPSDSVRVTREGKAYMQSVFKEYLEY
ncbi:MAG: LTA synthase family protein [Flavobacteriales bacterium]|nr:LTA synthase family protein [Flavobacteriales bacterium]MCB9448315.1 LTA synthase family protein [Flavobacteriales bacterium]